MELERFKWSVEDGVGTITFNRPDRLNALDDRSLQELRSLAALAAATPEVRAILIVAEGRGFCAGADVKFMLERAMGGIEGPIEALFREGAMHVHQAIAELRRTPKPVVVAVNGPAAGAGVGIALAGDIVWAAKEATFTLAYTKIGLAPDGGTTYFLTRIVGEKRAMELFLTAETLSSEQALQLGMVTKVFPSPEELLAAARAMARRLAAGPTVAYGLAKACVVESLREGLETQLHREGLSIARASMTEDFLEGVGAFVQKRPPEFKGR